MDDAGLQDNVELGRGVLIDDRPVPKGQVPVGAVLAIGAHTNLHHGNMTTYRRMKDIVPPTSPNRSN